MIKLRKQNEDFNLTTEEIKKFIKAGTTHILIDEESNEIVASFATTVSINEDNQAERFFSAPIDPEDEEYFEIVKLNKDYKLERTIEVGGFYYKKPSGSPLMKVKILDIKDCFAYGDDGIANHLSNFIFHTGLNEFILK